MSQNARTRDSFEQEASRIMCVLKHSYAGGLKFMHPNDTFCIRGTVFLKLLHFSPLPTSLALLYIALNVLR